MESLIENVEFPEARGEIIVCTAALADLDYQWRVWVRQEFPEANYYDDFTNTVNNLADTRALEWPEEVVGLVLRNDHEVQVMRTLNESIDQLFHLHGTDLTDEQYLRTSEWGDVVHAATAALAALGEGQ